VVEPGVTPRADIVLGPWHTWTQWAHDCALSRMWAGAHFRAAVTAVTAGPALGTQIGDSAYIFVDRHIRGAVGALR
jgi:vanadium-dependent haloperoxidase-like protein